MRNWLLRFLFVLMACVPGFSQTRNIPSLQTPNAFTAQNTFAQVNSTLYVAQVSGMYPSIQSAITSGCAVAASRVVIQPGTSPTDTIAAVTGGCTTTPIIDQRTFPDTCYTWGGSSYTSASCGVGTTSGTQYSVGMFNTVSGTQVGNAPMTFDAGLTNLTFAGGNINAAKTSLSNLSVNGTTGLCNNTNTGTCEYHSVIFSTPSTTLGSENQALGQWYSTAVGPGRAMPQSVGVTSPGGWRTPKLFDTGLTDDTRGIGQLMSGTFNAHAISDKQTLYFYFLTDGGGGSNNSDEEQGSMTLQTLENNQYFHGTVATGGVGATKPTFTYVSGSPWTTDGAMLLDITKGTVALTFNGSTTALAGTSNQVNYIPVTCTAGCVSGGLPLTTAWAVGTATMPDNGGPANVYITSAVTATAQAIPSHGTPALVAGLACLYDAGGQFERVTLSLPSGVLNVRHRYPHGTEWYIFQGGICESAVSVDADLTVSGERSTYTAYGSLTGTDLIYTQPFFGSQIARLPRYYETAETSSSVAHLYPMAEIVQNQTTGYAPEIEQNDVNWAVSDVVENPHPVTNVMRALFLPMTVNTFSTAGAGSTGIYLVVKGAGVSTSYRPVRLENENPFTMYTSDGGTLQAPSMIYMQGPIQDAIDIQDGPSGGGRGGSIINVEHTFNQNAQTFALFTLPAGSAGAENPIGTWVNYSPTNGLFDFHGGDLITSFGAIRAFSDLHANGGSGSTDVGTVYAANIVAGSQNGGSLTLNGSSHANIYLSGPVYLPQLGTTAGALCMNTSSTLTLNTSGFCNGQPQDLVSTIASTAFATNTMLGAVFYQPNLVAAKAWAVRLSGTLTCATAPAISLMDLGTSAATAFGSAAGTVYTLTTGTSAGAYSATGSVNMTAGHYYGYAITAGACATPPTIDAMTQVQ